MNDDNQLQIYQYEIDIIHQRQALKRFRDVYDQHEKDITRNIKHFEDQIKKLKK